MTRSRKFTRRLISLCFALVLISCGGGGDSVGGGDNSPGDVVVNPPPPPPKQFTDVTTASGIRFDVGFSKAPGEDPSIELYAGGMASGDYDSDGDIDLFVVRGNIGPNLLYRNDGNNVFSEVAAAAGVANTKSASENFRHSGPMFADMDGDGDLDLFVGGVQGDPSLIFANNSDGTFSDVTAGSGIDAMGAPQNISAAFGDYDLDGDLDLLVAHWGTLRSRQTPGDTEHIWRNESTAAQIRFVSVSVETGISPSIMTLPDPRVIDTGKDWSLSPVFARMNDDLFPDVVMVSDGNTSMVFMNNGDGTFRNSTDVDVIQDTAGMGTAIGDYDNDGDLDWFVTSIHRQSGSNPNGNRLYRNDAGQFSDVTDDAGVADGGWGWAACFEDLNNDGSLDLYHTNGWPHENGGDFTKDTSRAFISNGDGTFADQAHSLGIADRNQGRGAVCADFDSDGDIDIFLWSNDDLNTANLFRNDASVNNYLAVKLLGLPPNTAAAGARIHATVGGVTQLREVKIGSNFISQNPTEQVFGIGTAAQVDSLTVEWPDGAISNLNIVPANQHIVVDHPDL